jgi:hypothetical protein
MPNSRQVSYPSTSVFYYLLKTTCYLHDGLHSTLSHDCQGIFDFEGPILN